MKFKKRVIGLSGVARAGKDTFAAILMRKLTDKGFSVMKIALADPLKGDCDEFLQKHFKFSAFTQVPDNKLLIRPMLVWYGDAQRKLTGGRYWIDKAQTTIDKNNADFFIVTDVRYCHYERDEIHWLKNECNGVVCHISKWTRRMPYTPLSNQNENRIYVQPANDHEALNDPKVKALADYCVEWEHVDVLPTEKLVEDPSLIAHVDAFISTVRLLD
jgi:hypothetical protein